MSGRLGYAWDRVLIYAKGGGAWVATNSPAISVAGSPSSFISISNSTSSGYTAGFGVKSAFRQLVGARRVRLHRVAQPELYGNAGDADFRRRRYHVQHRNISMVTGAVNYKLGGW